MSELHENRLKRLSMRSWRRGTKEMDLVLGPWSDMHLKDLTGAKLDTYEQLLNENDQDLLPWVLGQAEAPEALRDLIAEIGDFARARLRAHH
ncbi:succinate dehydrogenase assembly factor 2 [Falsigemmobacter intermedius]|uniref:FAD assembly factor SdhE n=1 Tax=Falsigemmobacter intermedius TaxID=1553448 RepID=UPI003F004987